MGRGTVPAVPGLSVTADHQHKRTRKREWRGKAGAFTEQLGGLWQTGLRLEMPRRQGAIAFLS